ncbi:MAG: polysaccharide deacetylase family protein [Acidimicrobiales bacterium]|nr:polysaccharide deacetylase family protein [Acidimicrobiales bacterium]
MPVPVCLSFDNMGLAADVGRGTASAPDANEPGLRVGYPAILDLLNRHGVTSTFFVEGWNGVHHPDRVAELLGAGHEVAVHGWVHERWQDLDADTERELLTRAIDALTGCGADIQGFRAPGGHRSAATMQVLADLGLRYDSSLDPAGAHLDDTGIAVLPFEWPHVDWHWFGAQDPPAAPEDFAAALRRGLAAAAASAEPLVAIVHARTSALAADRLEVVESFVSAVLDDDRFELLPLRALATRLIGDTP